MINYVYRNPGKIIFGKDCELEIGKEVAGYAKRVLIVLGGPFIKENGLYDRVASSLSEAGITYYDLDHIVPNPRLKQVCEGIEMCRKHDIGFVLAIGGGSAIDTAKSIAAGVKCEGDIWEYFGTFTRFITDALPCGVLLTLPATGSESSNCAVLTNEETGLKRSLFSDYIIPRFAMLNPEMSYSLPPYQTACGTVDILAHLMEAYFTNTDNVDLTDRLLEAAMKTVIHFGPLSLEYPDNYDIRAELYQAANITNNGMLMAGRLGDWGSHNIEHEISGIYDIAHGAGLAIIFPAWIKYVWKRDPDRFVQFAQRVFDVAYAAPRKEWTIKRGIKKLEEFYREMNLPTRLSEAGIGDENLRTMAEKAMIGTSAVGMAFPLQEEDIYQILKLAL